MIIGYASWVRSLDENDLKEVFEGYASNCTLGQAFQDRFGKPLPRRHEMGLVVAIVAASVDEHAHCQLRELELCGFPIRAYEYALVFASTVEALSVTRCAFEPHLRRERQVSPAVPTAS